MITTPAQQEILRTRPQQTTLDLFIFQPRTVFQAQVNNASITKGARTITYDSVTLGSFTAIEAGMTLLIGTSPGGEEMGSLRIRSATASEIVVSENSNINWSDNLYLTVLRFFDLWPVYPRIINDPSNAENVIFYKDYDIAYSGQNSTLGTFICAGPHRPIFLESNGTGTAYYSATGTYNLLGNGGLLYEWAFEGGTPTGSTQAVPGYVAYNTPGDYVTRLRVTDPTGSSVDTTYRYVSVRNRIGEGSTPPVVRWEMGELVGSRDEGGYSVELTLFDTVSINSNAIVMLASDDWYGGNRISIGGNYPNTGHILFVGFIDKGSIQYDYQKSMVKFTVVSITGLMKTAMGFSVSVASMASPAYWYELLDMDVRRALYHYLRWHTTLLSITDFQFVGTDYPIQFFDADRTSMFDALDNLMRNTLHGKVVSDRQGKIWAEVDAMAYSNPTGSFPSVMSITKRDWMGEPVVDYRFDDEYSYIEFGGIQYSGVITGTFAPLMTCAPGPAPSFRGRTERLQGMAIGSQSQLNALVGNVFANRNSRFPTINLQMTENLRNLDIAPQESCRIIVSAAESNIGQEIDRLYIPHNQTWSYDPKNKLLLPRIVFQNVVSGFPGDSIIIASPEILDPGFAVPGITVPPLPVLTIPPAYGGAFASSIQPYVYIWESMGEDRSEVNQMNILSNTLGDGSELSGSARIRVSRSGYYLAHFQARYNLTGADTVAKLEFVIEEDTWDFSTQQNVWMAAGGLQTLVLSIMLRINASQTFVATWSGTVGDFIVDAVSFYLVRVSAQ